VLAAIVILVPSGAEREFVIMEMTIIEKAGHEMTVS